MKYRSLLTFLFLIATLACVQKTFNRTVVYQLRVDSSLDIKSVGIRGVDRPLSWQKDSTLKALNGGKVYQATINYRTGYTFTEVKFTLNGEFELKNEKNRRVNFSNKDTTYYQAVFNKVNP